MSGGVAAFRTVTVVTAAAAFAVIVLGSVVRLTDSGISCPDWPLCYGYLVPTPARIAAVPDIAFTYVQVMYEWVHRLVAGFIVGPLTLILLVWAFALRRRGERLAGPMTAAFVLVLIQAGLGGVTVLDRNSPWSVALHLSVALLFLASLILVHMRAARPPDGARRAEREAGAPVWGFALALVVALAALASGAMVAKSGASLACTGWPLCNGALIPALDDPLTLMNFIHRVLALTTVVVVVLLPYWRPPGGRVPVALRRLTLAAAALLLAQVAIGAVTVFLDIALWIAVLHHAVGVLLFATLAAAALRRLLGPAGRGAAA